MNDKHKKIVSIVSLILAIIFLAVITWQIGAPLVRFASEPEKFRMWVNEKGVLGKLAFIGMVIVQVILALIPGEPFEIAAGYAFGAFWGTVLSMLAAAIGSTLVFLLVRRFGRPLAEVFFSKEKLDSLSFLKRVKNKEILYLIIYMIPGTPKDLLSYFAGLTNVKIPVWLIICSLGRFPSIITSTIGGDAIGTKNYMLAVVVFVITMVISIAGILVYKYICKKNEKPSDIQMDLQN